MFIPTRSAVFRLDLMAFEIQDNHAFESLNWFRFIEPTGCHLYELEINSPYIAYRSV